MGWPVKSSCHAVRGVPSQDKPPHPDWLPGIHFGIQIGSPGPVGSMGSIEDGINGWSLT